MQIQSRPCGLWRPWFVALMILLVSGGLLCGSATAAARVRPFRIGVLTESWGPPPQAVSLRDELEVLGYSEPEDFVLGVRFTRGDITALPAAARQLVQHGVERKPVQFSCRSGTTRPRGFWHHGAAP